MFLNGASNHKWYRVGILLVSPHGWAYPNPHKLNFKDIDNATKWIQDLYHRNVSYSSSPNHCFERVMETCSLKCKLDQWMMESKNENLVRWQANLGKKITFHSAKLKFTHLLRNKTNLLASMTVIMKWRLKWPSLLIGKTS